MIIFIISLSKLVMLSVVPMGLVYVSLRAVIWAFAFVSRARRVFSKDYSRRRGYRRLNRENIR